VEKKPTTRLLSSGSVEESSFMAHKLPGDDGGFQCVEALPSRPDDGLS